MSEHSPTPWTLDTTICVVWDRNQRCVLRWESGSKAEWIAEMEFIVKCVNLHDELVAVCRCYVAFYDLWKQSGVHGSERLAGDEPEAVTLGRALLAKAKGEA